MKRTIYLFFLLLFSFSVIGQNINGQRIMVGIDAPAFLIFNAEVVNAEFNSIEGSKYYSCKVRNNNSMRISFKGKDSTVPDNITLAVQEGKRNHYFIIYLNKKYDINSDPSLWYDYSNLKQLKKYIEQQQSVNKEDIVRLETEEKEKRKKEIAEAQKRQEDEEAKSIKELEDAKRQDLLKQQETEKQIAQAKEEERLKKEEYKKAEAVVNKNEEDRKRAEAIMKKEEEEQRKIELETKQRREEEQRKQEELARLKTDEDRKKAETEAKLKEEEKRKRDAAIAQLNEAERLKAEALAKKKEEDDRIKAEELARQEERRRLEEKRKVDALAKASAEEIKKKEIALAAQEAKRKEEEKRISESLEKARAEEERKKKKHEEVLARLKQLEEEKEKQRQARAYSRVGLWERYGSKGITIFDLPEKQIPLVNADFYLTTDTVRNFNISQELLDIKKPTLNISSEKSVNGGVSLVLESIIFSEPNAYFKILISNKSKDDFLMGATGLYWYNADGSPKKWLKCSYITYIKGFPIVPPGHEVRIVLVTRDANIEDDELLDINMSERREDREKLDIIFDGKVYNKEKGKIEKTIVTGGEIAPSPTVLPQNTPEQKSDSQKRKNKKKRNRNKNDNE